MASPHSVAPYESLEEMYNLRKRLYENKDTFYTVCASQDTSKFDSLITEEDKKEFSEINEYVQKGKDILMKELAKSQKLSSEKMELVDMEQKAKSICYESQKNLELLKHVFIDNNIDTTELDEHIDTTSFSLGSIYDIIQKNVDGKRTALEEEINKSLAKLTILSKSYNIIKNTTMGHICPICLTNEVDRFCDPCGHSFCSKCIQSTYCYMCRVKINRTKPIYFS